MRPSIDLIEKWLRKTIIGLNLCPFAKRPFENNQIRLISTESTDDESQVKFFLDEISILQTNKKISTSLLIFENASKDFQNFYDLSGLFEDLIEQLQLSQEFQIVCFHPKFVFEKTDHNARVNYVNRSPLPLIHIIRSFEVESALSSPQEGEQISFNNEKTLSNLSDDEFLQHFPPTFYS